METPCIHVCLLDEETGLCAGCHRSMDEIVRWANLTDAERRRIIADLPNRRTNPACHHPENASA